MDLGGGQVGEHGADAVLGAVEEDRVGDGEGDGDAGDLPRGDEADGERDERGRDLGLGDGEGGLHVGARADGDEDAVPVHARRGAVVVDRVHERGAYEVEDAAADVPGEVVPRCAHDGAVGDTHDDQEDDEWEQAHAGFEGGVVAHELEE